METIKTDLGVRDRWLGITKPKAKLNPTRHHNKVNHGKHMKLNGRPQENSRTSKSTKIGKTRRRRD